MNGIKQDNILSREQMILQAEQRMLAGRKPYVIAIDGRCASGKTTFADMLALRWGCGVIHMDDFFLPVQLRSQERLAQIGGNMHLERFKSEILPYLRGQKAFSYRVYDCSRMCMGEGRMVQACDVIIVEGAYSCFPDLGNYMDLRIFMDVGKEEQHSRILSRNGEVKLREFEEKWIPREEAYFETYHVREQADIIVADEMK